MNKCNSLPTNTFPTTCASYPHGCSGCSRNTDNIVKDDPDWGTYSKGSDNYKMNGCQ